MREIEFRGKDINTNEWIYGCFGTADEHGDNGMPEHMYRETCIRLHYIVSHDGKNSHIVYPYTVGQYSGTSEQNAKTVKFFEGDILKGKKYSGIPGKFTRFIGEVIFANGQYRLNGVKQYKGLRCDIDGTFIKLGDKWDNPELVE